MRFLRVGSRLLGGCLLLFIASGGVADTDSNFASEFKPVFENLLKDKETAKWVDKVLYDLIRHGLDRKTANIIADDEFVKRNRPLIDDTMRQLGDYGRNMLRSRGAESAYADNKANVPGQYAGIRQAAQRLAKFFNFSKEMRSNLNVFVVDSPIVNAFAYGSLNTIEIALFTGLIEKLNEPGDPITAVSEMVKGTIAHELAHAKNKHVEQRLIVISIFLTQWKNVIPSSKQEITTLMKDQAMQSLYNIDPQQALASQQSELYRELFDYSWDIIERLAEDMSMRAAAEPEKFDALVKKFDQTFRSYDGASFFADLVEIDGEAAEGQELSPDEARKLSEAEVKAAQKLLARYGIEVQLGEITTEELAAAKTTDTKVESAEAGSDIARSSFWVELIRFIQALSKLSRSHEVTSDRFEQIATSEKAVQNSFARLGGGLNASPAAMMRQAEKWAMDLNRDPDLQKALNEGLYQKPPCYPDACLSDDAVFRIQLPQGASVADLQGTDPVYGRHQDGRKVRTGDGRQVQHQC